MLILTRRIGESLMIGDDVIVTVLGSVGNQVKIGVSAPKNVPVHREEIYQKIQEEKSETPVKKPANRELLSLRKILGYPGKIGR